MEFNESLTQNYDDQTEALAKMLLQEQRFRTLMAYYRSALMEIETKLKVLNESLSVSHDRNPIETIKCRLKDPKSIIEKLWRKQLPFSLESIEGGIQDIAGIRVICAFPEDVYLLAEYLLRQDDIKLVRIKDYIQQPKASGYRSLHLIVQVPIYLANEKKLMNVEIQLRTISMDFWASLEHKMKYKKDLEDAEEIAEELRSCAQAIEALDAAMQSIRNRIDRTERMREPYAATKAGAVEHSKTTV
ncbi:MAG: GTP pyrophosphokinase family protein [Clostridia bacterium]|nr:GTP pyrophosphokinase family protein [Clostridia bacterium]